jgi:lipopolysaccharide export system permease protein
MRLLDRYLLRELLVPLGYCLSGFLVFSIAFDLFDKLSTYQRASLTALDIAQYYLVTTPELMVEVLPVAFLLAILYALTNHARHQELTAMRAAGLSLARISAPYLFVGFLLSLGLFALNELWVPRSADAAEQIRRRRITDSVMRAATQGALKVGFVLRGGGTCYFGAYNLESTVALDTHLVLPEPDGGWQIIQAPSGVWTNGAWTLFNAEIDIYPPEAGATPLHSRTNQLVVTRMIETPEQVKSHVRVSRLLAKPSDAAKRAQLSIAQIRETEDYYRNDPVKMMMLETQYHGRIAAPWTCLMVVLIAIPFGAAPGRRNVFVGVASSLFICFTYFILMQLGLALGTRGVLPGWLAAWAPNLFFGGLGLALAWRIR